MKLFQQSENPTHKTIRILHFIRFKLKKKTAYSEIIDSNSFCLHKLLLKSKQPESLYGLLKYTYNDETPEPGYYSPWDTNIGDYIQSIAARQFLPSVDAMVDRDQLSEYGGKPINLIMNSWYLFWKKNSSIPKQINPLFVSVHIHPAGLNSEILKCLKEHEPIGCRDFCTRDLLWKNGISAYFSGCLTLTLGKTYYVPPELRTGEIYFVDMEPILEKKENIRLKDNLFETLSQYDLNSAKHLTHSIPFKRELSVRERFALAEELIRKYAHARLVVTQNLHCALPCLALHVPVIFVAQAYDSFRFSGLMELTNHMYYTKGKRIISNINLNQHGEPVNSDAFVSYSNKLSELCETFCSKNNAAI